jgi:hypothetical protein
MPPEQPSHDDDTILIEAWLRGLGYDTTAAIRRARAVLEAAGLTHQGKRGIASYKRSAGERALTAALVRVCSDECARLARATARGRHAVITGTATCEVCGGSNNRRAALACTSVLRANGVTDVLVVGGTAQNQVELRQLLAADGLHVECVDGTRSSHSQKDAIANMNRAQLIVIWGSTPLRHSVSNLYTAEPPPHLRVITVARRGIEALCSEIVRSYEKKARR